MVDIWEVSRRATTGQIAKEVDFEAKIFPAKMKEIVDEHKIKYNPEEIIPQDMSMVDEIFQAGMEFAMECGFYHKGTKRIVKFTESELKELIRTRPKEATFGRGHEQIKLRLRSPQDKTPPITIYGGAAPISEDIAIINQLSQAIEKTCQGLTPCSLLSAGGIEAKSGQPEEMWVQVMEALWHRDIARRAGKPGLFLTLPMSTQGVQAIMASFFPEGYTSWNALVPIHILQDMRLTWERMNLAYFALHNGIKPWTSTWPTMYAYCRGPEDVAVEAVASILGMLAYGNGNCGQGGTTRADGLSSTRDCLWANSAIHLAMERNLHFPWGSIHGGARSGPCQEVAWWELAAYVLTNVASGIDWMWAVGCGFGGAGEPAATGMEARWAGETARAVAGIDPRKANEILLEIVPKYENIITDLEKIPRGKGILETYDIKTLTPKKEYLDLYEKMRAEMEAIGIKYP